MNKLVENHKQKHFSFLGSLCLFLSVVSLGCLKESVGHTSKDEIPSLGHDLSYIPYDAKLDRPNYVLCDSTNIISGRNRLQYIGGANKLRNDITSNFSAKPAYASFSGYIVIRFLVNCEGESGRYRAQPLNLDFSPADAPSDLLAHSIALLKSLDTWAKSAANGSEMEYSKYINLKINDGKIQHVLL